MSELFQQELARAMTRRAQREQLLQRRQAFVRRLKERQLAEQPKEEDDSFLGRITPDIIELALSQIGSAIKETPAGMYEMVKAPVLDARDLITKGDFTPERTGAIGKAMATGLYEDFRHPLRNPGYLFLDLVGLGRTPFTAASRMKRASTAYKAARRGEAPPEPRQPLPHGNPPPKDGGYTGAVAHPEGRINDPDVPRPGDDAFRAAPKVRAVESEKDALKHFKATGAKAGIVMEQVDALADGTLYKLYRNPRGAATGHHEYRVIRYPKGKPGNAHPVGDPIMDPKEAMLRLGRELRDEANQEGRFAPKPGSHYKYLDDETGEVVRVDREQAWKERKEDSRKLLERERQDAAATSWNELSPIAKTRAARDWVESEPEAKVTVGTLRHKFGIQTSEAKKLRDTLIEMKVINKSGTVSKAHLAEVQKVEEKAAVTEKVTERGGGEIDDFDALVDDVVEIGDADIKAARAQLEADEYEPLVLREKENGDLYLAEGLPVLEAAKQIEAEGGTVPELRYEVRKTVEREPEPKNIVPGVRMDVEEPKKTAKPKELSDDELLAVVKAMPVFGTPTVEQIMRRTGVKKGKATEIRRRYIEERPPDPEAFTGPTAAAPDIPKPPVERPKVSVPLEKATQGAKRILAEEGPATAKEIAKRLGISESMAAKAATAARKEIAAAKKDRPHFHTPAEKKAALAKVKELWDADGKAPSIQAIRDATGFGYAGAKSLRLEEAKRRRVKLEERADLRGRGVDQRARGVNPRLLTKAGVPEQFQPAIRKGINALYNKGKRVEALQLQAVFRTVLGDEAGKAAYAKWNEARMLSGGAAAAGDYLAGPATKGQALRVAAKEFRRKPQGGSYLLAVVNRRRSGSKRLENVFDKDGNLVSPAVEFMSPDEAPSVEAQKLVQKRKIERLAVEAPLADDPILRKFQTHRYKWMAKEQSTRVAKVYARVIRADNFRGENSAAVRHVKYQLRELDRHADNIEAVRSMTLTKQGFIEALAAAGRERSKNVRQKRQHETSGGGRLGDSIDTANQLAIIGTLFMKPAYLTPNLMGQAFLVLADHAFNPINLIQSMRMRRALFTAEDKLSQKRSQMIRAAMHEGIMDSIGRGGASANVAAAHGMMALFYSKLMDDWFREVSFMHEARRHGFGAPDKFDTLFEKKNQGKLVEISRRANKNIIDFGNLSPMERTALRRAIFFYPWIKASALYTARFPFQHPVQSTAYVQAAKEGEERRDEQIGPVPSYLEGSFRGPNVDVPFFGNLGERTMPDGSKQPRIINPAAASIFGSLGEAIEAAKANFFGTVRESEQLSDYFSPALNLTAAFVMRRDPFTGREFPQGMSAGDILLQEASQYLAPLDMISDVRRAGEFERGDRDPNEVLFPYTAGERIGRFVGGVTPYTLNKKEARSRAAAETRGLEAKSQRERLRWAEKREELFREAKATGLLPQSATQLPKAVRDAFSLRARREANLAAFQVELGRDLTNVDRLYADLSLLVRMKKMPEGLAKRILENAQTLPDPMVDRLTRQIREAHFGTSLIGRYTKAVNTRKAAMGKERISG